MSAASELRFWKTVALGSVLFCGALWWWSPTIDARTKSLDASRPTLGNRHVHDATRAWGTSRSDPCPVQLSTAVDQASRPDTRCNAIARLAHCRQIDAGGVERIARYTSATRSLEVRMCATSALGETQSVVGLATLIKLVDDPVMAVAETALRAVAQFEDRDARDALVETARNGADGLRMTALSLLAERRDSEAVTLIAERLDASEPGLREHLLSLLGVTRDPRALTVLSAELTRGPRSTQHAAINALGEVGGEGAGQILLSVLESTPSLAPAALQALSRTGAEESIETLLGAARGEYGAQAVLPALSALVPHESADLTALMQRELLGENPNRVNIAMEYLANHAVQGAVPTILRIAREGGQASVWSAINALSRIPGSASLAGLEQLASVPGVTAQAAIEALAGLPGGQALARKAALARQPSGGGNPGATLDILGRDRSPEARAALIEAARGSDATLSVQALGYLAQRQDPESLEVLAELAANGKTPIQRATALSLLDQSGHPNTALRLREGLRDASPEVRAQAVQILIESNSPELEAGLLSASRDTDLGVANAATSALAQLGTPSAITRLEEIAGGKNTQTKPQALHALASVAPARAAGFAEQMAASGDRDACLAAVQVANTFSRPVATRILGAALAHGEPDVMREALAYLGQLGLSKRELAGLLDPLAHDPQLPDDLRSSANLLMQSARE